MIHDRRCPACNRPVYGTQDVVNAVKSRPAVKCQHCGTDCVRKTDKEFGMDTVYYVPAPAPAPCRQDSPAAARIF